MIDCRNPIQSVSQRESHEGPSRSLGPYGSLGGDRISLVVVDLNQTNNFFIWTKYISSHTVPPQFPKSYAESPVAEGLSEVDNELYYLIVYEPL